MHARRIAFAVAALAALALLAPAAGAHAVLSASTPAKGSRLATAPASVSITLTEPADPAGTSLQVLDAQGKRVDLDDLRITAGNNPVLTVSLPPGLPDGAYRIVWQALSGADGHTTRGTVGFAVGDFVPPDSQASDVSQVAWLGASGRFLAFAGLALALGAALFLVWVPGSGSAGVPRKPSLEALLVGAALHLVGVAFLLKSTLDQTGLSVTGLAQTSVGETLLLRLGLGLGGLAFAGLALAPRNPARLTPHVAIFLLACSGLGSANFGHASLAGLGGIVLDAMHLFAATAWVGGLLAFLWLLVEARRFGWAPEQVRLAGVRFGTAALVCVAVLWLAGAGAGLAILGRGALRDPLDALSSPWGAVLAAKMALTLAMLAIAAVNRYGILEPPTQAGFSGRVQRLLGRVAPSLRSLEPDGGGLRRLLRVEALLGVAVLALAGILTSISPPSAAAAAPAPLEVPGYGADFHGELTVDPAPAVGASSTLTVHVETHQGTPVEGNTCGREPPLSCVNLVVGGNETGGGESHAMAPLGGGDWRVEGILWTAAGETPITVHVATSEVPDDPMAFAVFVAA